MTSKLEGYSLVSSCHKKPMQSWIKFVLNKVSFFSTKLGVDLLQNSGIKVVSVIAAYIDTFVLVISLVMESPLLDSKFPDQDRSFDGGRDYMKTLQGTWTQIIRSKVTLSAVLQGSPFIAKCPIHNARLSFKKRGGFQ